jgi:hypothetical protein
VTKAAAQAVADLGSFLTTHQWFVDADDPFHRAPSVMTYDRETNQTVLEDSRVWVAGLSDEGGAGSWLAAIMKEWVQPNREELDKLRGFVDGVLWGGLQSKDGPHPYGVRKSLFYYQPDLMPRNYYQTGFDWTTWTSWNKQASEAVDRSYNYPHVAAAYWVFYRLARNHPGLITNHSWNWYLTHAYETSMAMTHYAKELAVFGQMEGSIFVEILADLKREGMNAEAAALEAGLRVSVLVLSVFLVNLRESVNISAFAGGSSLVAGGNLAGFPECFAPGGEIPVMPEPMIVRHGNSPLRHCAAWIPLGDLAERRPRLLVLKRMQHRYRPLEAGLDFF